MSTRKTFWTLLLIISIASFLRLYHITSTPPGLYPDEAMEGNNAVEAIHNNAFKVFYPENNGTEGLYVALVAGVIQATGVNTPWAVRLPAAIAGILTVLGLYFLGKELYSKKIGLLAALFLATSFWHINFSRIGFRAILAPLLLTWALTWFLKALRRSSEEKPSSIIWALAGGVVFGLGFYTYIAYRITPLIFLLAIPFLKNRKGFWRTTLLFVLGTFVVALPIGLYFVQHPADFFGRTSQVSITNSAQPLKELGTNIVKTLGMFFINGDGNWRHNIAGRPELFLPIAALFLMGIVQSILIGLKKLFTNHIPFETWILGSWFVLAALPVVISNEGVPHALRSILMIPPIMIFAALGFESVSEFAKKHFHNNLRIVCAVIFFGLIIGEGYISYFVRWANNPEVAGSFNANYVAIGQTLNALPIAQEKYVIVQAGGVDVRGIPMPAQTVMFITGTYEASARMAKHIHYVLPSETKKIPPSAYTVVLN